MNIKKDNTALLIMDFENDMVDDKGKLAAFGIARHVKERNVTENTKKVLTKARSSGLKIIFVKVEYEKGYPELKNSKAPMYAGMNQTNALIKNTWGADLPNGLKPLKHEIIISKSRINPFTNKNLKKELKNIRTIILTGVATNFVVESAARTAADENYEVFVVEDCCASFNQQMHEFSIKNILPNITKVVKAEDLLKSL